MALKFYAAKKAGSPTGGLVGGIHDGSLQDRLIQFFKSSSCQVDAYDGGEFPLDELVDLTQNVVSAIQMLENQDLNWQFNEEQILSYYKRGEIYGLNFLPPRDQALADVRKLLNIIEMAKIKKLNIFFEGD